MSTSIAAISADITIDPKSGPGFLERFILFSPRWTKLATGAPLPKAKMAYRRQLNYTSEQPEFRITPENRPAPVYNRAGGIRILENARARKRICICRLRANRLLHQHNCKVHLRAKAKAQSNGLCLLNAIAVEVLIARRFARKDPLLRIPQRKP